MGKACVDVAYLVEGMIYNHLAVGVWDPREQVAEPGISLCVDLCLGFGDRLGLAGGERCRGGDVTQLRACLFDDALSEVVAAAVHLLC